PALAESSQSGLQWYVRLLDSRWRGNDLLMVVPAKAGIQCLGCMPYTRMQSALIHWCAGWCTNLQGATLVASATAMAPACWLCLPRPTRHGGASPVTFRRRGGSALPALFFVQPLDCKSIRASPTGWHRCCSPGLETGRRVG